MDPRVTAVDGASTEPNRLESALAQPSANPQDEHQNLGNGAVERLGDFRIEFDLRQRLGEAGILLDRDAVGARRLDDPLPDIAASLRGDTRRSRLVVMQRDRERSLAD